MTTANNFRRIRPVSLFETSWKAGDLESLKSKPGVGDVTREVALPPTNPSVFFGPRGRSVTVDRDIWGVDWSSVSDDDWNENLPGTIFDFPTAYLEFQLTVASGIPGDSILFAYNAPGHDVDEGIHSYTHLQIPSFGGGDDMVNTGQVRTVSRDLIEGFAGLEGDDPEEAVKADTRVSLYGVGKTAEIAISVECVLLGGFAASAGG